MVPNDRHQNLCIDDDIRPAYEVPRENAKSPHGGPVGYDRIVQPGLNTRRPHSLAALPEATKRPLS